MTKRSLCLLCATVVVINLLLAGCATEQKGSAPPSWNNVRPGMQMEQVHALLGTPNQHDLGGAEEIYFFIMGKSRAELHVQYNASGTVCAKRYHYID
jgi:outer membrane protein assembly factor BamE (lipoprotein component of BamABCDE complex)